MHEDLVEVPVWRPSKLRLKEPKKPIWFLKPQLKKESEGKQHFVKSVPNRIQIDNGYVDFPTSLEGLKSFMKDINPGYHQSFLDEEKKLYESLLDDSQLSDLKEIGQCDIGVGDILQKIGQVLLFKEKHGSRFRNFSLSNVVHLNNFKEVPDEEVTKSSLYLTCKLEHSGLYLPNMVSQGSIARGNILEEASDGYFPLWILPEKELVPWYDSVKGPNFRAFTLGDSPDTISSDLVVCYAHILLNTPSPSPFSSKYIFDTDYHPEASFAACKIWIDIDQLEVTPVGVRVSNLLWEDQEVVTIFPKNKNYTVYPWGRIKKVSVNLPTLWFLVERLKLRPGRDFGIIEGLWVIPNGKPIFPWRDWARKIMKAITLFPELKYLYRMGPTGGKSRVAHKIGEGQYTHEWVAFNTENPIVLSHLFDMTKIIVLLGIAQSRKVKGISFDGWVSEGGAPDSIGPVKIGSATYGPFPVRNTALELFYQFDQQKHDEIISVEDKIGTFWRDLAEEYSQDPKLKYIVEETDNFGKVYHHELHYGPSSGDNIPKKEPEVCGDTLGQEIGTKPCHSSQAMSRLGYIREPDVFASHG